MLASLLTVGLLHRQTTQIFEAAAGHWVGWFSYFLMANKHLSLGGSQNLSTRQRLVTRLQCLVPTQFYQGWEIPFLRLKSCWFSSFLMTHTFPRLVSTQLYRGWGIPLVELEKLLVIEFAHSAPSTWQQVLHTLLKLECFSLVPEIFVWAESIVCKSLGFDGDSEKCSCPLIGPNWFEVQF